MWVPVRPASSRMYCTSRRRASTSCSCRRPLIVVATLCFICALQAAKKGAQRARRDAKPVEYRPLYSATFRAEMQLENSFSVAAPPDRVFAYLLDVNKVVGCVPGAELSEVVETTPGGRRGGGDSGRGAAAAPAAPATAKPVNAFGLLFSVLWARLRGVFGEKRSA